MLEIIVIILKLNKDHFLTFCMDTPSWCLMRTNQMCTVAKWIVAMSGIVEQRLCCTLMVDRHECWCNIVVDDAVVWKQCSKQNLFLLC